MATIGEGDSLTEHEGTTASVGEAAAAAIGTVATVSAVTKATALSVCEGVSTADLKLVAPTVRKSLKATRHIDVGATWRK